MDIVTSIIFAIAFILPSLLAHAVNPDSPVLGKRIALYIIWALYIFFIACLIPAATSTFGTIAVTGCMVSAILILFKPIRQLLSPILTVINKIATLSFLKQLGPETLSAKYAHRPVQSFQESLMLKQVLLPASLPHVNALVLSFLVLAMVFVDLHPDQLTSPMLGTPPKPRQIDIAFFFSSITTLIVVAFGVGLPIKRKWREVLFRVGLVKPGLKEFGIGAAMCIVTFFYDYLWSLFTHASQQHGSFSSVMNQFNSTTYMGNGGFSSAIGIASAVGLSAGFEEEICIRGALQPVIGIVPSAFMHAALHMQFAHAPMFIIQIFVWSALMGVLKYYTNTTTTLIAHTLFNFISCFLIAFNP